MHKIAIIVAGGKGSRLKSDLPKQFHLLKGLPILMHTISAFQSSSDKIIVALESTMHDYWHSLCNQYKFSVPHDVITGGKARFYTVKNALQYIDSYYTKRIDSTTAIAIHDGARPLISTHLIDLSFQKGNEGHANALAIKSNNSIRIGSVKISKSIDRDTVWQMQTPQTFPAIDIIKAYSHFSTDQNFTDDCSVWERTGQSLMLIESESSNIKITESQDIAFAEILLESRKG